jgi:hypothetical protein
MGMASQKYSTHKISAVFTLRQAGNKYVGIYFSLILEDMDLKKNVSILITAKR